MTDEIRIEYIPLEKLVRWPRNPKKHAEDNIQRSIERFGFISPILIDETSGRLVAGHGRIDVLTRMKKSNKAAPRNIKIENGEWKAPVVRGVSFNSEAEAEAYLIADNSLTALAGWDDQGLLEMLHDLPADLADIAGYTDDLIKELEESLKDEAGVDEEENLNGDDLSIKWAVAPGQYWKIGPHVMYVGSGTDEQGIANLMAGKKFSMVFTRLTLVSDFGARPYQVNEAEANFMPYLANICRHGGKDWTGYLCFMPELYVSARRAIFAYNIKLHPVPLVWVRTIGNTGRGYNREHETIVYIGDGIHTKWYGKGETSVWQVNSTDKTPHELSERAIRNSTQSGDLILDLCGETGSTMIAAQITGRVARVAIGSVEDAAVALERMSRIVEDIEMLEPGENYPVPEAPETWVTKTYRLAEGQAKVVDDAIAIITKQLKGDNQEGRALELMAADFLSGEQHDTSEETE